jgi:hypothetical protein
MTKVGYLFFLKNYVKGNRHTMLYSWGASMLDCLILHQNGLRRRRILHVHRVRQCLNKRKSEIHEGSRRESSIR